VEILPNAAEWLQRTFKALDSFLFLGLLGLALLALREYNRSTVASRLGGEVIL